MCVWVYKDILLINLRKNILFDILKMRAFYKIILLFLSFLECALKRIRESKWGEKKERWKFNFISKFQLNEMKKWKKD